MPFWPNKGKFRAGDEIEIEWEKAYDDFDFRRSVPPLRVLYDMGCGYMVIDARGVRCPADENVMKPVKRASSAIMTP